MLELRDVSLAIGKQVLVKRFSLTIAAGEIVTLMGPSGSGKSSLLAMIAGDLPPAFIGSGDVLLKGKSLDGISPQNRRFGRLFQDDLLFPHMTIGENLLFAVPKAPRIERLAAAGQALQDVELAGFEDRAPHTLSGGQRSRVALMRAVLARPSALLLDEPFNKLDQALRQTVRMLTFNIIRERNIPALLVTHDRADAPDGGRVFTISTNGEVENV